MKIEPVTLINQGQRLFGMLHLPDVSEPPPTVLILHGYGGTRVGGGRIYVHTAQELAKRGIASLRVDFRGCGDSDGEFHEMTVEGLVSDATCAFHYLTQHSLLDPSRIGVLGCSLGGAISCLAASELVDVQGIGLWAPLADGSLWEKDWNERYTEKEQAQAFVQGGCPPVCEEFRRQFRMIEAHTALEQLPDVPLFHCQGDKDQVIFEGHLQAFQKVRPPHHPGTRYLNLPNSDHHFTHSDDRAILIRETADWFKKIFNDDHPST